MRTQGNHTSRMRKMPLKIVMGALKKSIGFDLGISGSPGGTTSESLPRLLVTQNAMVPIASRETDFHSKTIEFSGNSV